MANFILISDFDTRIAADQGYLMMLLELGEPPMTRLKYCSALPEEVSINVQTCCTRKRREVQMEGAYVLVFQYSEGSILRGR
jgi:hypothetical protein